MYKKQVKEKMTRRTLLQSAILSATGLLGLQRLVHAMTPLEPVPFGQCRVVTCYNAEHGGYHCNLETDPGGYECIEKFYCQHFECNQAGEEFKDFNCEKIFGCPKDTGDNKFQCTGVDAVTADFNCYATGSGGNFTCNPGVRFSCRDFHCNPDKGKFNCVSTSGGEYQCGGSIGTLAAYAEPIVPPEP